MDDEMYWELLEEQHAHDVVMVGAEGSEDGDDNKVQIQATDVLLRENVRKRGKL